MFRDYSPQPEAISSPYLKAIFDHWIVLRRGRASPDVDDFDPTDLPPASLRYIIMADVTSAPLRFRYRLVGTHAVEVGGFDFTGKYLDELEMPEDTAEQIRQNLAHVANACMPLIGRYDWPMIDENSRVAVEYIILPLTKDGQVIRLLTAEHVGQDEERFSDEIVPIIPINAKTD
jgi:hypothetical protein